VTCAGCGQPLLPSDPSCPECGTPSQRGLTADPLASLQSDPESHWADLVDRLRRATLGQYEIGRELGRGGMAAVFLAHDISLDRKVAIKVMAPGLTVGEGLIERFRHEAVTIAQLYHPNIVSVYSVRQAEGLNYFVMRYVEGRSLEQIIQQAGPLPLPLIRSILAQVGSALIHAHRSRVIHRDIKPANILVDREGNAVVTDFGIAKVAEAPSRTLTGALVGTPAYMSPEQCRGSEVSWASDQYALGVVAYEMLTGSPPFTGSTLTVMQSHVERSPVPPVARRPDCPPELEAAILRMLAKEPAERWLRMPDALAALGAVPLDEEDPLRAELVRLAAADESAALPGAPTPTSPAPLGRVGGISILPPPAGLEVGDSFVLVAMVRGQHGTRLPPNLVTWTCDDPDVLRFESGGGVAAAVGAGAVLLTATCNDVTARLRVEVAPARADEIVIDPIDRSIQVGDEIRLEAGARDKRGQPVSRPVTWTSADTASADLSPDGVLVARATGFVRVTASLDEARATIVIPILPARVAAIHVADWPASVPVGAGFELAATPVDRWGNPLAERTVVWTSSDVRVAQVTEHGNRVQAVRPGSVVLTAACEGVTASVKLAVAEGPGRRRRRRSDGSSVLVAALLMALLIGGALWVRDRQVPAEVADTVATRPPAPDSLPGALASLPPAVSPPPPPESAKPAVRKRPAPRRAPPAPVAASVTIAPLEPLRVGDTATLQAAVLDAADNAIPGAQIGWHSSNANVAAVDSRTGRVEARSPGTALIIAQSGEETALSEVSVVQPEPAQPPPDVALDPAPPDDASPAGYAPYSAARDDELALSRVRAGVAQCYNAVKQKDVAGLAALYQPATRADEDNLRKLSRILRTREWDAAIGARVDGRQRIGADAAEMEFSFRLTWKDAFGGRVASEPVFRAEFTRKGSRLEMESCRILGSPRL
jgi:uncharacterized protein YjdB